MIELAGNLALPRFGAETGIHRFPTGAKNDRILVGTTDADFAKFQIPDELAKRDSVKFQFERRIYDTAQKQVKDLILNENYSLENVELQQTFEQAIEENLQKTAENLIE